MGGVGGKKRKEKIKNFKLLIIVQLYYASHRVAILCSLSFEPINN